jgi:outer membrane receptor protein involved in Fe transport
MSKRVVAAARVASGVLCLTAIAAAAQQAAAPAGDASSSASSSGEIQQIVVTAQKRKEDIRKVPLSVSVVSAETLQNNQVVDFTDLTRNVPNVSFSTQAGAGLGTIEIRGVSSQAGQATVSIYLDDISLTTRNLYSQGTAEPRFFDLDRVEVLRGPQGTLYGASSLGGTIKFISKQPDAKRFSGYGSAEVSSTSHGGTNYQVEAVVNVPLVKDSTALRVGVQSGHDSGYIDQVDPNTLQVINKGINSTKWNVVKLALKADLGNGWTVTPAVFAQDYKSDDIDAAYLHVGDYQGTNAGTPLPEFQTSKPVREPGTDKLTVPSLTVSGDVGIGDFTGVLSGYNRRFDRIQDGTSINSAYIGSVTTDPALGAIVGMLPSQVILNNKIDQTSLEARVASKDYDAARSPFTWVAGIYASQTKTQVYDNEPVLGITKAFQDFGHDVNNPADLADTWQGAFTGDSSYYSARHYDDKQSSVFGELTWHASPELRVIGGLRLVHATQVFTREGNYYYTSCGTASPADCPTVTPPVNAKWSASTPRLAVDWDVDKTTTLYANVAKGFRLGGANRPIPDTPLVEQDLADRGLPTKPPVGFDPDSLWNYEVGSKSRLWGGRLLLNTALFYIDWKNIQQDVTLTNSGFDFETNAGHAKSYGVEFDARVKATEDLTLTMAGGITRATFAENVLALGKDNDGNFNVRNGDWVQGVPRFSAQLGAEYHFALSDSIGAVVRANGQWTGRSHGSLFRGDTDYDRAGYFKADASAGLSFGRYDLTLFVKNLTNENKMIQQPSVQGVDTAYYLRPRTIGLRLSADI